MNQLTLTRRAFLAPFLITFLVISSCKKDPTDVPRGPGGSHTNLGPKVNEWLEEQASKVTGDRSQKIESLRNNINWSTLHEEDLYTGETMLVASVNPSYKTENNKGKNPVNYVLFIVDKEGKIRKGNIVQYLPAINSAFKTLENGFFTRFYNSERDDLSGTLTFLTVSDDLLYEMSYEKGRLKSHSVVERKPQTSSTGKTNIECYDVWWVTYYPDGSTTWEYLYSFCNGGEQPCKGSFSTNGRTYLIGCGGGGGGEEGGDEVERIHTLVWTFLSNPDGTGVGEIKSVETAKGKKNSNYPQGGYFTSLTHNWSTCNFCTLPTDVWWETSHNTSASAQTASITLVGNLNYDGQQMHGLINTKSWAFQEVFP